MDVAVIGAGPTGLFMSIALARRGHAVVLIDRDPGPTRGGTWNRRGVMQFHHAHTFRPQVAAALAAELPDVLDALLRAGAGMPSVDGPLLMRRELFERVLRRCAATQSGITHMTAHVDAVVIEGRRATGVSAAGRTVRADLVVDATGRAARLTDALRPPGQHAQCGAAYVTRQYRLDGPLGPVNSPVGLSLSMSGYAALAFVHDNRTFSITLIHDGGLRELRQDAVFEAAVAEIPELCDWADRARSTPLTGALAGGTLSNSYRGQSPVAGLVSVGDAVCTTTPLAGRGVALAYMQAQKLVELLTDTGDVATEFDAWCTTNIRPWFDDHVHADTERLRRWAGEDVDVTRPLPSDLIVAAAAADPQLRPLVGPYTSMTALPSSLAPAEPRARAIFASGWRPPLPPGPDRRRLAELCGERELCAPAHR